MRRGWVAVWLSFLVIPGGASLCPQAAEAESSPAKAAPGLRVAFSVLTADQPAVTDVVVLPNLWLYVPAGKSATPFLAEGRFRAVWQGFVTLDLRSEYRFQAEINGELKLEINGVTVLESTGTGAGTNPSQSVRLNKGANRIAATFRSPPVGDAFVRVTWTPKLGLPAPIPSTALSHAPDAELARVTKLRLGRDLFIEQRCIQCHSAGTATNSMQNLNPDAPSFEGIGTRRNVRWMAQWILDPKGQRPTAQMPRVFHGQAAREDAEAAAAFLASLTSELPAMQPVEASDDSREAGRQLFENLHCVACHTAPDATEQSADRLSLKQVRQKFAVGALPAFLMKPESHYAWIRMPNFHLGADEAAQLAGYLAAHAEKPADQPQTQDKKRIERGKALVQTSGCLNCHSLKLENRCTTKPLSDLAAGRWNQGCLASAVPAGSKAPFFGFSRLELDALQAFGASDRVSLSRRVLTEFADRQIRDLKCQECHGKFDGFPPLEIVGGKLKPEWISAFIAGRIAFKPRPWIPARMPAFATRAKELGQGMAMLHGFPPVTPAEGPIDREAAKTGQKLVSADGGFSCIACHAVGQVGATQVFDSAGVNLIYVAERLQPSFFRRWVSNPLAIDPTTKMPVYFDEMGKSPLADIFDGDGGKQIDAIWQYLRLGDQMPPPPGTLSTQ